MALARALKNVMRAAKPSRGDITSGKAIKTKDSKQHTWPKDPSAVGPHYFQDEPMIGVVQTPHIMK